MNDYRQKMKDLLPIIQAYCDGDDVEVFGGSGVWMVVSDPLFAPHGTYRIKQTPDTIDWSHVHEDYKWMARDRSGEVCLFKEKPTSFGTCWSTAEKIFDAGGFISYKQGTVDWKDSLVERPE